MKFLKETNVDEIREIFFSFLYLPIKETGIDFIANHPIFESFTAVSKECVEGAVKMGEDKYVLDLHNPVHLEQAIKDVREHMENANLVRIYMMIRTPYKLAFLKYAKDYMSKKDFSEYLADAWVGSENPNQDINVSIPTLYRWYKNASKKDLMVEEDYEYFLNLPDEITVYRGVGKNRNPKGLSWTDDYNKAVWFANRWNNKGYILKGKIKKENVLAYFNTRDEKELVCYIDNIYDLETIESDLL